MANEQIGVAVLAVISLCAGVLANRWGLFGAGNVWRTCLFWATVGAALAVSMELMQVGVVSASSGALRLVTLMMLALGILGGALGGLLMAYLERRWPD